MSLYKYNSTIFVSYEAQIDHRTIHK